MKPGTWLLKIAPFLFNERFLTAVVRPTIADLQSEVAAAPHALQRVRARSRGYAAFWMLVAVAPFATWSDDRPQVSGSRLIAASTVVTIVAVVVFGVWAAFVTAAATLALLLHLWYERHPSAVAVPPDGPWRSPQINFSSTDVAGNVGGLIFAAGSVVIVSIALPFVRWFLLLGSIAACLVAWALVSWHTRTREQGWARDGRPRRQLL
ncbi:MAG TPA: hypothetical protein VH583_02960 [Vicinamibacterales bacterium]|jgi:hypothetical protein